MSLEIFSLSESSALLLSTCGALLTVLFMSIEYLYLFREKKFHTGTFFSWEITSSRPGWIYRGWRINVLNYIFEDNRFRLFMFTRILIVLCLFFSLDNHLYLSIGLGILFCMSCLLNLRHFQGRDGADETLSILLFGLMAYYAVDPQLLLRWAGPVFIIAQLTLSYFISGYYKLISKTWRSGQAIKKVIATEIYGKPSLSFTVKSNFVSYTCCWMIILWEVTFPVLFIIPYPYFMIWLVMGVIFHLSMALIMGLNTFMMAFLTTYPLFYCLITIAYKL